MQRSSSPHLPSPHISTPPHVSTPSPTQNNPGSSPEIASSEASSPQQPPHNFAPPTPSPYNSLVPSFQPPAPLGAFRQTLPPLPTLNITFYTRPKLPQGNGGTNAYSYVSGLLKHSPLQGQPGFGAQPHNVSIPSCPAGKINAWSLLIDCWLDYTRQLSTDLDIT